jgi:chemotaxis protein methyltransferase CheR
MAYTSFFRDNDALDAITRIAIPALSNRRAIRVWDAGCASGEEPYTLAIIFAANLGPFMLRNLDILATDHEESSYPQFEERIRRGLYDRRDIQWVPEAFRAAYFAPTGNPEVFEVAAELKSMVRYRKHDLLSLVAPEEEMSLVVCKNVLMHFPPEAQERVVDMFFRTLVPGGFLALDGNQQMPHSFLRRLPRVEPGAPLYRKPEA